MSDNNSVTTVSSVPSLSARQLASQVFWLALWPLLENGLTFLVGITDLMVSSRMATGEARVAILDAMGLGSYVGWFFNILQGAVGIGVMALVSRAIGARDESLAQRGLGQGLWLGLMAGFGSLLVLQWGIPLLIEQMQLSPTAAIHANDFLRVLAWSGPFSGAMMAINAALRGSGDTRTPFLAMVVVNVVNMILSCVFVYAPAPWGGHGVAGIAAGTVIGWAIGLMTVVFFLYRPPAAGSIVLRWVRDCLSWHRQTMARIVRVGIPQSMEVAGMWLIHLFGVHTISQLPIAGALGAHIIAIRVESMSFMPGFAIATAAAALTGQYLGAGNRSMAIRVVRFCWKLNVGIMSGLGLFFAIFRERLVDLLAGHSVEHQHLAAPLLLICACSQPAFATCILLKTTMRGAGATPMVMRWAFAIMVTFRIGILSMLHAAGHLTLAGVWIVFAVDLWVQAVVFAVLHYRGKWLNAKV